MIATDNDLQTKIPFALTNVYDFAGFTTLTAQMVAEGTTTGPVKSESRIDATKLNIQRINRLIKTTKLLPEWDTLFGIENLEFLAITETWCGDGAQILPVVSRIADHIGVPLRIILRDEYPDIIDRYQFRNTRSIPVLIAFNRLTGEELGWWGPKPADAQKIVDDAKINNIPHDDYVISLQNWYNQTKTIPLQQELLSFVQRCLSK
ncbi:MAG TPA: thioredoxin family protein [Chitinophagales bacterium]|nr:thioredoxin family protein [Chitinophagales bacterium]HNA57488.1 thioredoxin family protein [Chitinophagales bacterium]HNF69703.1 thioredoxin family protein [Chitinophagales bacterium]HNI53193.1 thioredoxin family protein [Chitinophagales bacterium]HNJ87962.1 thioredoxin family protein [Chitinophagales bacterium]